jgi:hypothetical protein
MPAHTGSAMMLKEWLLVAWIGTTTNFTMISSHPTQSACDRARAEWLATNPRSVVTVACTQNLSEGRGQLPSRSGSQGLVK